MADTTPVRPRFGTRCTESPLWPLVQDYLAHLRVERGSSSHTISSYQRDLARYVCYLADRDVTAAPQVDAGHISEFLQVVTTGNDGGTPLAERSAARMLASVRGVHRYWAQNGVTSADPSHEVAAPVQTQSLPKALSVSEVTALVESPQTATPLGLRDRALLEFLYASGARISEAVSLDVDDVHLHSSAGEAESVEGIMLVRVTGKGNKQRMVPLGRMARAALGNYLTSGRPALTEAAQRRRTGSVSSSAKRSSGRSAASGPGSDRHSSSRSPSPALFVNKLGGRLSRQSGWTIVEKAAAAAGITAEVSPHTLRHSCATHLLDGGADIRTVQELLGHASVTTTQIYTKVTAESLRSQYVSAHPRAL